ncbi:MAG: phosphotransferase, partial [Actinomycetes bacterium]
CADETGATLGFAKVQIGDEGSRSVATLSAVRRGNSLGSALRLPEPIGYLPERHMALYSTAPGRPLHQLDRTAVPAAMAALGTALSGLHRQPYDGLPPYTRLDGNQVTRAGELVQAVRPDLTLLVRELVDMLLSRPRTRGPAALLHGDLHPKNVLVHDAGVSLVDLDQAGVGPAASELGATLARLWYPRPGDEIGADAATAAGEELLASYERPPATDELLWYAASALLVERAARAVGRVDLAVLAELERVLATALRWAGRVVGDR